MLVCQSSRPHCDADRLPHSLLLGKLGKPEVQNLRLPTLRDEDVGGLDVAMDDAFGVRRLEGIGDLCLPTTRPMTSRPVSRSDLG